MRGSGEGPAQDVAEPAEVSRGRGTGRGEAETDRPTPPWPGHRPERAGDGRSIGNERAPAYANSAISGSRSGRPSDGPQSRKGYWRLTTGPLNRALPTDYRPAQGLHSRTERYGALAASRCTAGWRTARPVVWEDGAAMPLLPDFCGRRPPPRRRSPGVPLDCGARLPSAERNIAGAAAHASPPCRARMRRSAMATAIASSR